MALFSPLGLVDAQIVTITKWEVGELQLTGRAKLGGSRQQYNPHCGSSEQIGSGRALASASFFFWLLSMQQLFSMVFWPRMAGVGMVGCSPSSLCHPTHRIFSIYSLIIIHTCFSGHIMISLIAAYYHEAILRLPQLVASCVMFPPMVPP